MLKTEQFIKGQKGFRSLLNYYNFIDEGVVLNKDGSLTASFYYFGVDLDSFTAQEKNALCSHINTLFSKLDGGWTVNVDSFRLPVKRYPLKNECPQATIQLLEQERREHFENAGSHFQSIHALSLTFKPGLLEESTFRQFFVSGQSEKNASNMNVTLDEFNKVLDKVQSALHQIGISIEKMDSESLFSFLHYCVTGEFMDSSKILSVENQSLEYSESIDFLLGSYDFTAGLKPTIDGKAIGAVSVMGFPLESHAGILDILNTLPFEYRTSCRFIVLDPIEAHPVITKKRSHWNNLQFNLMAAIFQIFSPGSINRYGNDEAVSKAQDAHEALNEAAGGLVRFGYYTLTVIVIDENEERCGEKTKYIAHLLRNKGFPSRVESINAVESYLGAHPGNTFANVRKPIIHSFNLSHLMPLNSPYLGEQYNPHPRFPKDSSPLLCASTVTGTPYFCNIHVLDIGHHFIIGGSGAGKTTKQRILMVSFLRYPNAQVFVFDNQKAFYCLGKACGADYYEILGDQGSLEFCPLQNIDNDSEKLWAAGWIEELITLQGVNVTPRQRQTISEAVDALQSDKVRSLSNLYANLQDRSLKVALDRFVSIQNGVMAKLLDANKDNLSTSSFQIFEVGELLNIEPKFAIPVISYLFHKIEMRLDGRPTLIVLSETWRLFNNDMFASKINEWLRQCRAKNAAVSFETHSLNDINGPLKNIILGSCQTKIFLPNPMANKDAECDLYKSLGLNDGQINVIANAVSKKHYYWVSPMGSTLVDLELQPVFLSLIGKNTKEEINYIKDLENKYGSTWPAQYLEECGLKTQSKNWMEFSKGGKNK